MDFRNERVSERELDARIAAARRVAALAYADPREAETIIDGIACDAVGAVRDAAGVAMVHLIGATAPVERVGLIARWASSPEPGRRAVLARALCAAFCDVCVLSAIEELARDRYAEVRRAACEAAACHLERAADRCLRVLAAAAHDNRRFVRTAAIDGLHKAVELGLAGDAIEALVDCGCDDDVECADRAVDALADALEPDTALAGYEAILDRAADTDEEVLRHVIEDVERVGRRRPDRARALLTRFKRHPTPWVRHDARVAWVNLGH